MICYKLYVNNEKDVLEGVNTLSDFALKIGINKIDNIYKNVEHIIPLEKLFEMAELINDKWGPIKQNGEFEEQDEIFITDFTSLVHSLFNSAYVGFDKEELFKTFVPID